MNALVPLVIIFAALFAASYLSKRRFGVLGLALCAGSLLSASWAATLTPWVEAQGVSVVSLPMSAVVSALLILLPPSMLFFSGPTYSSKMLRLVGSAAFALMAFVFLLGPIGAGLVVDPLGLQLYNTLLRTGNLITIIGIIAALADILTTRVPSHKKSSEH